MRTEGWRRSTTETNRAALRAQLADAPPPGVLAYLGGDPVGWAAVAPRTASGVHLEGAVELAAASGATVVEGYPVDVDARASVSSSELYHGSLSLFLAHGFREVHRSGAARVVVRRDAPAGRAR